MKVLVVAAHPDDEVLGCGATIARLTRKGHKVHVAILGEGVTARHATRKQASAAALARLKTESRRAGKLLGAAEWILGDLPDNRFDSVPLLDIVKRVEALINRLKPETVYTHHAGDLNVDHELVHRAVVTATRPVPGCPVREVLAFEVPSSTEWGFQREPAFKPTVFVDVTATLNAKVEALKAYTSEVRAFPHPRSPEALRAAAARWGSVVGCRAAEAFQLIRGIR